MSLWQNAVSNSEDDNLALLNTLLLVSFLMFLQINVLPQNSAQDGREFARFVQRMKTSIASFILMKNTRTKKITSLVRSIAESPPCSKLQHTCSCRIQSSCRRFKPVLAPNVAQPNINSIIAIQQPLTCNSYSVYHIISNLSLIHYTMVCSKCQKKLKSTELATPGVKRKNDMYYGSPASTLGGEGKSGKATLGASGVGKV